MAICTKCGRHAGYGVTEHEVCPPEPQASGTVLLKSGDVAPPLRSDMESLVAHLQPLLRAAATRAGVVAAFTFAGIFFVVGILYAIFMSLATSPASSTRP